MAPQRTRHFPAGAEPHPLAELDAPNGVHGHPGCLGQLEGSDGALDWIDTLSRPSGDGPVVHDEAAMRGYSAEVNLALAKVLLAQQARISELEAQPQ
jgi:hypothetical protein